MSIIIDPEFRSLIPPLSTDEYTQLEKNIVKEGIRDALIVWPQNNGNSILVDGHNRFQISVAHAGIRFEVKEKNFKDRDEAIRWIILNQFGRRNLSLYDRSLLALKLKPMIAEKAKENLSTHTNQGYQKSDKAVSTTKELAKVAGVSHDTIHKVETIEAKATDQTKQLVREGKLSINQAYNSVHPKRQDPVKQAIKEHEEFQEKKKESVVDFESAKIDKINERIIDSSIRENVLKLLNAVTDFGRKYSEEDVEKALQNMDEADKNIIKTMSMSCQNILLRIMNYTC